MNDPAVGDDEMLLDSLIDLRDGPLSPLRIGDMFDRIKTSRGDSFARCTMALLTAAKTAPGSFDLRLELAVLISSHPPLVTLKREASRRQVATILVTAVSTTAAFTIVAAICGKSAMMEWAIKIVAITGVPGLALLLLYFFFQPIANKLGLSKLSVKGTEKLVLILAIGLLLVAALALAIYGAPDIIKALRDTAKDASRAA